MYRTYKRLSVALFGRLAGASAFSKLKPDLHKSGTSILIKTYASMTMFTAVIVYFASLAGTLVALNFIGLGFYLSALLTAAVPVFCAFLAFALLYFYPSQKAKTMEKSIENDMPFAIAHMSAISSSGIPPEFMFELLSGFKEYREISRHASLIVRNIKTFGMSSVAAIKSVAKTTPSATFKQVLNGIAFNIEKGGNLTRYLKEMSDKGLFEYRLKREKYMKTLSTYADIYTALLVAAPLMMLAVLAILSVIGGEIIGLSMSELINALTFGALPAMNILFLVFIHITYPGV